MEKPWFHSKRNVLELCVFLVQTEQIITADEIIHFLSKTELYSEVWMLYEKHIGRLDEGYI